MKPNLLLQIAAPLMIDPSDTDAVEQVRQWFSDGSAHLSNKALGNEFWKPVIAATSNGFNDTARVLSEYRGSNAVGASWSRFVLAESITQRLRRTPARECGSMIDRLEDGLLATWCVLQLASQAKWPTPQGMPADVRATIDLVRSFFEQSRYSVLRLLSKHATEVLRSRYDRLQLKDTQHRWGKRRANVPLTFYLRNQYGENNRALLDAYVALNALRQTHDGLSFGEYGEDVILEAFTATPPVRKNMVVRAVKAFAFAHAFESILRTPPENMQQLDAMLAPGFEAAREVIIEALFTYPPESRRER